ncbi:hypothetical protein GCM10010287_55110 [Streptomyces variabilis]|uniref:Transcriptional regulator n=1 Tax=Streptomyces variabilis TaxID=67372 RepID=A0ABQ2U5T9_9ACTN|nr:hypothetical protein GCM10010265_59790 [Streptomyces griseoincarnatus]GGT73647.1 hypothetical protein GCM10010287_55110 [Streptomyces variabilis]
MLSVSGGGGSGRSRVSARAPGQQGQSASALPPQCSRAYDHAVSYDIYFFNRPDGQSWDELLEAMEKAAEDSEPIPAHLLGAWDRIVPQARTLLGAVELTEYERESRDLSHLGTGIDLSVFGDEVTITVPYWHAGDDAAVVFGQVSALAAIVEKETGLTAYDPQTERPLAETPPEVSVELMSRTTEDLRSRYEG